MVSIRHRLVITFLGICFSGQILAQGQVFQSEIQQTGLLELYTSEGCSSCPPADRWVGRLKNHKLLWKAFVPVAFHVDYWDYIGWKDRFASPRYSKRQRLFALQNSLSTVYTPGFLFNGKEWRSWRKNRLDIGEKRLKPGTLKVTVEDQDLLLEFIPEPGQLSDKLIFNVALLGFDISTRVKRGENSGKQLEHEFVVLDWKRDIARLDSGIYQLRIERPMSDIEAGQYGIAAWVNSQNNLSPIQATGGYLNPID